MDMLESDNDLMMGIFLKSNKTHFGNIKLGALNRLYSRADIGIMIGDQACWGKGYATEAISCLCRIAFDTIGIRRLTAGAYASNKGSIKAFLKAGFRQEGVLNGHWMLNGKSEDGVLLGKMSEQ
jgi:RimJ/RimL family protein N-acetyltransferase